MRFSSSTSSLFVYIVAHTKSVTIKTHGNHHFISHLYENLKIENLYSVHIDLEEKRRRTIKSTSWKIQECLKNWDNLPECRMFDFEKYVVVFIHVEFLYYHAYNTYTFVHIRLLFFCSVSNQHKLLWIIAKVWNIYSSNWC